MPRLYVIAGHGAGDPGAGGNGYQEAERVRALASRIKGLGGEAVELHDFADNAYESGALSRVDVGGAQVVELHMDSGPAGARGGHVIYCGRLSPDEYDRALADEIASIFPGRANTLVGRTDLANPNRAANRGIPYRLVENGFITSAGDVAAFNSRLDDLARAYLRAFGIAAGAPSQGGGSQEPEAPGDTICGIPASTYRQWCRELQAALSDELVGRGMPGVAVDGVDGPETERGVVRLLQDVHNGTWGAGLEVDGIIGPATLASMAAHPVGLPQGCERSGDDVWCVKMALVLNGWDCDLCSREWTKEDHNFLCGHQQAHGLATDGVCGPDTLASLLPLALA